MKKDNWITIIIILLVITLALIVLIKSDKEASEELATCIGENSVIYTQLGCHACEAQEKIFGKNYKYLNSIDCFFEKEKCSEIEATPTWLINDKKYKGFHSIETLKELTGC